MWKLVNKVYKPKGMCTSCYERKAWMRKRPCCNCVSWKWAVIPCPAGHPLGVVEEGVIPEDRGHALTGLRRLRRTSYLPLIVRDSSGRFQRIASEHTSGQTPRMTEVRMREMMSTRAETLSVRRFGSDLNSVMGVPSFSATTYLITPRHFIPGDARAPGLAQFSR